MLGVSNYARYHHIRIQLATDWMQPKAAAADAEISNKIIGVWKVNETAPSGVSSSGTVSVFKDGSVTCDVKYVRGTRDLLMSYTASWQVETGFLIEAIKTTSNSNLLAVGFVTRDKVLSLDDQKFVFETETGHKIIRERK